MSQKQSGVRFATFNVSLFRERAGQLVQDLSSGSDTQAQTIAEIIQRVRPDVLLLNEFDHDEQGRALDCFQHNYLAVAQHGAEPLHFPHTFIGPSNTGVGSGLDLDGDGESGGPGDAFGYGLFPGQYGMAVLSMWPIDLQAVRTFQFFLWQDMPGALLPPRIAPAARAVMRLSSKSHWDLPLHIGQQTVHLLAGHPTPPVIGADARHRERNYDEIRFWADYIDPVRSTYIYDDRGRRGGLAGGALFVIAGDLNADPHDGGGLPGAARQLTDHPLVNRRLVPSSPGGVEQARLQGLANTLHAGDPSHDTADFYDGSAADFSEAPGNLRVDYVLPSRALTMLDAGVFWPKTDEPLFRLAGTAPFPGSDHRLVWVDLAL